MGRLLRKLIAALSAATAIILIPACGGGGGGDDANGSNPEAPPVACPCGPATPIENYTYDTYVPIGPRLAVDGGGNVTAVWFQGSNVWSNRYEAGVGWSTARFIDPNSGGPYDPLGDTYPQVAVDANGNVTAVWYRYFHIWSNRYVAGAGWGTAIQLENNAYNASVPQLAVHAGGNVTVVWQQYDGNQFSIWSSRYEAGIGWGTAGLIETDDAAGCYSPKLAVDPGGNVTAAWMRWDGMRREVWSNRFVVASGWGAATRIGAGDSPAAAEPCVSADPAGNVTAVWVQSDGARTGIWSNRFMSGSGWGTANQIEAGNSGDASGPRLTADYEGNVTAVWVQSDGGRTDIWSNRYVPGAGWGTSRLIEDRAGAAFSAELAVDPGRNVTAVWIQSDGSRNSVWLSRYLVGFGWGTACVVETDDAGDNHAPHVVVDANGTATVAWIRETFNWFGSIPVTHWHIWSNRCE